MYLNNFEVSIPQGKELSNGFIVMKHSTKYAVKLTNANHEHCDASIKIDGKLVGTWRIYDHETISIEHPANDVGIFTFYQINSLESDKISLVNDEELGLISILFKPEKLHRRKNPSSADSSFFFSAGGTGLSGKSKQKFTEIPPLYYDESKFVQINIRLVCEEDAPRPLIPVSSPIPPAIG